MYTGMVEAVQVEHTYKSLTQQIKGTKFEKPKIHRRNEGNSSTYVCYACKPDAAINYSQDLLTCRSSNTIARRRKGI